MSSEINSSSAQVTFEELQQVVQNVARQYSKDLINGKGFDSEFYKDCQQELWVKAYSVMADFPNATVQYIYRCLWNYATDTWRKSKKVSCHEMGVSPVNLTLSQQDEGTEGMSTLLQNAIEVESLNYSRFEKDSTDVAMLVERVLDLVKERYNEKVLKYVVAKLKLNGYISEDFMPEVSVKGLEPSEITDGRYDVSADKVILSEILHFKNASTGGSGSFKWSKKQLKDDLMSELNIDECYTRTYEVTYQLNGELNSTFVVAYSRRNAVNKLVDKFEDTSSLKILEVIEE